MSSYMSQPRQFSTYQPEVNAEVYAGLLQKHETDYLQGVQRVEAARESVASLPIANLAARNYTQQKLDQITTELNQQQGTDWSDQGIQRLTNKHITTIADDPVVQNAVSSTAAYRSDYMKAKQSYEDSNGADVANQKKFSKLANAWINNPDVNAKYQGGYVNYRDINKEANEFLTKLKPDLVQLVKPSSGMEGWEKAIRKMEGINKQKLQDALDEFILTTPGVKEQMNVNAEYEYENYDKDQYKNRLEKINTTIRAEYSKDILDMERDKLFTTDPTELAKIDKAIKARKEIYIPALENYDYGADIAMFESPEYHDQILHSLYEKNWKYGILTVNSGGNKYEEDYGGMSPRETYFQGKAKELADKKYLHDISQDNIKEKQWERHFEWEKNKEEGKGGASQAIPLSPVRLDVVGDDFAALQEKNNRSRADLQLSKVDLLASMMASKGNVDDIGTSQYFDTDVATGKTVIKEGYIPLTAEATTVMAIPSPSNLKKIVYGRDYISYNDYLLGFTDKQGRYHNGVVDDLVNGQSAGGIQANSLSLTDRQFLAQLKEQQSAVQSSSAVEAAGLRKWKQFVETHPETKKVEQEVEKFFQPFSEGGMNFDEHDIREFYRYNKAVWGEVQDKLNKGDLDPELVLNEVHNKLNAKYGHDKARILGFHFNSWNNNFDQAHVNFENQKKQYLGDWAKTLGVAPIINGIKLTNGKEETVKDVSGTVVSVVNYLDPEANSYDEVRALLKKGTEGDKSLNIALGYDELNPDAPVFYEVNSGKGKSERVYFTEQNARTLGIDVSSIKPVESSLFRKMKENGAVYGSGFQSTITPGKINSWENASNILMTKDDEVRYVVEKVKGTYVLYKYWMHKGKLQPRESVSYNTLDGVEKKINELRNSFQ